MADRYSVYDSLAWFYDRYWGRVYHGQALPILERLLLSRLIDRPAAPASVEGPAPVAPAPPATRTRILDVCCGAGHLTALLAARGYDCTGIDGSEEMLAMARRNVPAAEFHFADARDFELPIAFDAAICTFESVNHMIADGDVERAFGCVRRALRPGGLFLFDILTEDAYRTAWSGTGAYVEDDNACILRGAFDPATGIAHALITMFRLESGSALDPEAEPASDPGAESKEASGPEAESAPAGVGRRAGRRPAVWTRRDADVPERCYPVEEIIRSLERTGFALEERIEGREGGMTGDIALGRIFILARRAADDPAAGRNRR